MKHEVIIYWSEDDQAFVAEVPELPGCKADGTTMAKALRPRKGSRGNGLKQPSNSAAQFRSQRVGWYMRNGRRMSSAEDAGLARLLRRAKQRDAGAHEDY